MISKANLRAYLFEDATGTPPKVIETDKIPTLEFNTTDFPNANTATVEAGVFYIYPTSLEEGKTEISIEGLFNGATKVYTVSLPTTPINANYRYILKAKKMDIAHIEWEIAIDAWEDGSEVEIEPGNSLFTFSDLTFSGGTGGIFDAATKTYDMTAATTPAVIRFRTSSINKQGTIAKVVYKYDTDGSSFPGFTVVTPETVLTYGASYTQDYTINIPVQTQKLPIRVEVTIWDAVSPVRKEIIVIHSLPNYDNTAHKPVLVGGKYWGPVNVGANSVDATTLNTASMGLMFQWGRNTGSVYGATGDVVDGPMTLALANASPTKFIKVPDDRIWLNVQDNTLWSGVNAKGPCPVGWRIPNNEELTILKDRIPNPVTYSANRLSIAGDSGAGTLYIPTGGYRHYLNGTSNNRGVDCTFWGSDTTSDGLAYRLMMHPAYNAMVAETYTGFAVSIRCVQK